MALAGEQDGWAFDNHSSNWLLNSLPGKENNILNVSISKLTHMSRLLNIIFNDDYGSLVFICFLINKRININTFCIIHMINKHSALHNFYDITNFIIIHQFILYHQIIKNIHDLFIIHHQHNTDQFFKLFQNVIIDYTSTPSPPQLNKTQQKQTTANQKQRKKATPFSSLKASPC